MNKFHNVRNSNGQFTRRVARTKDGKFTSPMKIVSGRLYNYKGATVRALKRDEKAGVRLVSFHKALFGFVQDSELQKIDTRKVNDYLAAAN
jgi:hypothetical protein